MKWDVTPDSNGNPHGVGLVVQDEHVDLDVIQHVEDETDVVENLEDEKEEVELLEAAFLMVDLAPDDADYENVADDAPVEG